MISFTAKIQRFAKQGEKTGWTYIAISEANAEKMNAGCRKSYRVKGTLDSFKIQKVAILPMGDGSFILPLNAEMRKATGKDLGDTLKVSLAHDARELQLNADFMECLKDDARAYEFFQTLPKSHQGYFSKWIDSAKTLSTKTKRITMAVIALAQKQGYGEMIRANRTVRD
ncbi:MAG TPA: YdeI/OmpD-associated family protein [Chryseosolibacter sp.]